MRAIILALSMMGLLAVFSVNANAENTTQSSPNQPPKKNQLDCEKNKEAMACAHIVIQKDIEKKSKNTEKKVDQIFEEGK